MEIYIDGSEINIFEKVFFFLFPLGGEIFFRITRA